MEETMNTFENRTDDHKPPMGAAPYYVVAVDRINELLSAIGRYVNNSPFGEIEIAAAKLWAVELNEQISLLDTLRIYSS